MTDRECRKIKYTSQAEARKALTKLTKFRAIHGGDLDRLEQRAYPCPICVGSWHLTSMARR